jgi:hypothetical protein
MSLSENYKVTRKFSNIFTQVSSDWKHLTRYVENFLISQHEYNIYSEQLLVASNASPNTWTCLSHIPKMHMKIKEGKENYEAWVIYYFAIKVSSWTLEKPVSLNVFWKHP